MGAEDFPDGEAVNVYGEGVRILMRTGWEERIGLSIVDPNTKNETIIRSCYFRKGQTLVYDSQTQSWIYLELNKDKTIKIAKTVSINPGGELTELGDWPISS